MKQFLINYIFNLIKSESIRDALQIVISILIAAVLGKVIFCLLIIIFHEFIAIVISCVCGILLGISFIDHITNH